MREMCSHCYSQLDELDEKCPKCGIILPAIERINEYTVLNIEMDKIYSDNDFNCRGTITPIDVMDLVNDIDEHGLQFPIAVQPAKDVESSKNDFRIVAGHRRFQAFLILKKTHIPAMIKVGLTEIQARLLNLGENLKRKALNILQEARAIERLRELGMNRRQVGEKLGVSISWVQVRYNLLDMPSEIQEEVAAGLINQHQIKELYSLPTKEKQYEAVRKIKEAKVRGEKGLSVAPTSAQDPFKKKRQQKNIVQEMIDHLGKTIDFGLHTRCLAWANGEISSAELYVDIASYAEDNGIEYTSPLPKVVQ